MQTIQGKAIEDVFTGERQLHSHWRGRTQRGRQRSHQVLTYCATVSGFYLHLRDLHTLPRLAVRLVMALGQSHQLPHYLQMILGVYATLGIFL
jgi:hypothetical protein